jgi:5'-3' exoribonuclease 2
MGVPAFFKWLRRRFPKAVWDCADPPADAVPPGDLDWSTPNLNGFEVDNLYVDVNGLLHGATHPADRPAPPDERSMMVEICAYIDKLATISRPRRLLFLAIDGVAPRAKMNQQRARRFLAAKEAGLRAAARKAVADEWQALGLAVPSAEQRAESDGTGGTAGGASAEEEEKEEDARGAASKADGDAEGGRGRNGHFDHTVITPGTPFMEAASAAIHSHVCARLAAHPAWRGLSVVFSDGAEAGEGEHKIMVCATINLPPAP